MGQVNGVGEARCRGNVLGKGMPPVCLRLLGAHQLRVFHTGVIRRGLRHQGVLF